MEIKPITEQYNFRKFWDVYTRQNRCVSKWDASRTDLDVFIRRTLNKWFAGKCFQVLRPRDENTNFNCHMSALGTKPRDYTLFFTKYVLITQIEFSYDYASNKLVFQYVEPHSERPKEALLGYNEFMQLEVMENETDFAILRKFYPVEKRKHDKLTLN